MRKVFFGRSRPLDDQCTVADHVGRVARGQGVDERAKLILSLPLNPSPRQCGRTERHARRFLDSRPVGPWPLRNKNELFRQHTTSHFEFSVEENRCRSAPTGTLEAGLRCSRQVILAALHRSAVQAGEGTGTSRVSKTGGASPAGC